MIYIEMLSIKPAFTSSSLLASASLGICLWVHTQESNSQKQPKSQRIQAVLSSHKMIMHRTLVFTDVEHVLNYCKLLP